MQRLLPIVGGTLAAAVAVTGFSSADVRQPATAQVMVHCPSGNRDAFVTPQRVRVRIGDNVSWRMNSQVVSDSIIIWPKNEDQPWPFAGQPSRGGAVALARGARVQGTYSYNVGLLCRIPGQGLVRVVIDPDIIVD